MKGRKPSEKEIGFDDQDKQLVAKSETDADGELYGYGETVPCLTLSERYSGFGGLEVACWPLVPKFAGSNPAEAVGFLRVMKILSTSGGMDVCLL